MARTTAILSLGTRKDATTWENGCRGLGFDLGRVIKKGQPTIEELREFFSTPAQWLFLAGHFGSLTLLNEPEEMTLIKKLLEYPDVVSKAARYLEPHRLPTYLQELAATFHRFYHHHQVVSSAVELTKARLVLVEGTRIVLANGLAMLGISAPERM